MLFHKKITLYFLCTWNISYFITFSSAFLALALLDSTMSDRMSASLLLHCLEDLMDQPFRLVEVLNCRRPFHRMLRLPRLTATPSVPHLPTLQMTPPGMFLVWVLRSAFGWENAQNSFMYTSMKQYNNALVWYLLKIFFPYTSSFINKLETHFSFVDLTFHYLHMLCLYISFQNYV